MFIRFIYTRFPIIGKLDQFRLMFLPSDRIVTDWWYVRLCTKHNDQTTSLRYHRPKQFTQRDWYNHHHQYHHIICYAYHNTSTYNHHNRPYQRRHHQWPRYTTTTNSSSCSTTQTAPSPTVHGINAQHYSSAVFLCIHLERCKLRAVHTPPATLRGQSAPAKRAAREQHAHEDSARSAL